MAGQPTEVEKGFVGCTLVYQAAISADSTATQSAKQETDELLVALLDKLRLQEEHDALPTEPLAASDVTGGKLWLLKTGRSGQENIYIALGAEEKQDDLNTAVLFGYRAALIRPDAIAHKAYFMAREYLLGDIRNTFRDASKALMDKTVAILSQPRSSTSLLNRQDLTTNQPLNQSLGPLGRSGDHISELDQLSDKAANLTAVTSSLRQLHSGLKIHRFNHQISLKKASAKAGSNGLGTQIGRYHRNQINNILFRLNEDLTDANATLQAANTAINSLRAKYEQQQTEIAEQQRQDAQQHAQQEARANNLTQTIFAVLSVVLAVGQLIELFEK